MPKIKIFKIHNFTSYNSYEDDYETNIKLGDGITDWEEVSNEDFSLIKQNLHLVRPDTGTDVVLVEQVDDGAVKYIKNIKDFIKKQQQENERRIEVERVRKEEAAKKLEKDRKAFERLIKDNPDLVEEIIKG